MPQHEQAPWLGGQGAGPEGLVCEGCGGAGGKGREGQARLENGRDVVGDAEGAGCVGRGGRVVWALYVQEMRALCVCVFPMMPLCEVRGSHGEREQKVLYPISIFMRKAKRTDLETAFKSVVVLFRFRWGKVL